MRLECLKLNLCQRGYKNILFVIDIESQLILFLIILIVIISTIIFELIHLHILWSIEDG